jgi:hypothetical protein
VALKYISASFEGCQQDTLFQNVAVCDWATECDREKESGTKDRARCVLETAEGEGEGESVMRTRQAIAI